MLNYRYRKHIYETLTWNDQILLVYGFRPVFEIVKDIAIKNKFAKCAQDKLNKLGITKKCVSCKGIKTSFLKLNLNNINVLLL